MIDPFTFFLLVLKDTLLSFGGTANLPGIHEDLTSRGWAGDQQFGTALAIGQLAPGPVGLWVVALGYMVAGLPGAACGAGAIVLPPLLVLPLAGLHSRFANAHAMRGFIRGIALAATGTLPVILGKIMAGYGFDLGGLAVVVASVALVASRKVPLPLVLAGAAVAGVLLYR